MYVRISPESFCITKQLCIYNDLMIMAYKNVYQKLRSKKADPNFADRESVPTIRGPLVKTDLFELKLQLHRIDQKKC